MGLRLSVRLRRFAALSVTTVALSVTTGALAMALAAPLAAQEGRLVGRVASEAGAPVVGAQAEMFPRLGAALSAVSDSSGGFRFGPIRPGTYRLEVRATGWQPASTGVRINADSTVTITVRLTREPAAQRPPGSDTRSTPRPG